MFGDLVILDDTPALQVTMPGDDATVDFDFPVWQSADVAVYLDGALQTLTTHYAVLLFEDGGGRVTFVTTPTAGQIVTIVRASEISRKSGYAESGLLRAASINSEFNRLTLFLQEQKWLLSRTIRLGLFDAPADLVLPAVAGRANKVIAFDTNGDLLMTAVGAGGEGLGDVVTATASFPSPGYLLKSLTGSTRLVGPSTLTETALTAAVAGVADHEARIGAAETTVASHTGSLANHETRVSAAETTIAGHTSTIGSHTTSIADHETRIGDNETDIGTLTTAVDGKLDALLDDTTPQLGGTLDVNGHVVRGGSGGSPGQVTLADNSASLKVGTDGITVTNSAAALSHATAVTVNTNGAAHIAENASTLTVGGAGTAATLGPRSITFADLQVTRRKNGQDQYFVAGSFSVGNVVAITGFGANQEGVFSATLASPSTHASYPLGIVVETGSMPLDGAGAWVVRLGKVGGAYAFASSSIGAPVYLAASGAITLSAPSSAARIIGRVIVASNSGFVWFDPQAPQLTSTEITTGTDTTPKMVTAAQLAAITGATDLSNTPAASTLTLVSSTGLSTVIAAATGSVAGVLDAARAAKVDALAASTDWRDEFTIINTSSATTFDASNVDVPTDPTGNANLWVGTSFKGMSTIQIWAKCNAAAVTANHKLVPVFSLDGGTSWILANGDSASSLVTTGQQTSALNTMEALTPQVYLALTSSTAENTRDLTLHSSITAADQVHVRVRAYSRTATGSGGVVARISIRSKRAAVLGATPAVTAAFGRTGNVTASAGDYSADQITDATDGSKVMMTGDERRDAAWLKSGRGAPTVFMRWRNVKRVTLDFGANNLIADGDPIANTGTNNAANLIAIRNSLTGPTDLIWGADQITAIGKPVYWNKDNLNFIGLGNAGCNGLWNTFSGTWGPSSNFYNTRTLFFSTLAPGVLNSRSVYRECWRGGGSPGSDILAGDRTITMSATDYAAVSKGDRICVCAGAARVYDTENLVPSFMWVCDVEEKLGSNTILISDPTGFPEPFIAANIAGNFVGGVSGYTAIAAGHAALNDTNVFFRLADFAIDSFIATPVADATVSTDFHATNLGFYNFLMGSFKGVQQGHMPRNSLFDNVHFRSGATGMVFNRGQNTIIRNSLVEFGSQAHESGVATSFMLIENTDFRWNGDATYGGDTSRPWAIAAGEAENNGTMRKCRFFMDGWEASTGDSSLIRNQGYKNSWEDLEFYVSSDQLRSINVDTFGDENRFGFGNRYEDIYIRNSCPTRLAYPALRIVGHGNIVRRVEGDYPNVTDFTDGGTQTPAPRYSVISGDYNILEDIAFYGPGGVAGAIQSELKLNSGASYNQITHWNSTVTDSSGNATNSIVSCAIGAARVDRRRRMILGYPSATAGYSSRAARADHTHAAASSSAAGLMTAAQWKKLTTIAQPVMIYPNHSPLTFTALAATVALKPQAGQAYVRVPSLVNATQLTFQVKISTQAAVSSYIAPIYSKDNGATWKFFDGTTATGGAAAPGTPANVFAISLNQTANVWYDATITLISDAQAAGVYLSFATFGGNGSDAPATAGINYLVE